MAKATITCTCAKCGNEFQISRTFVNRREADQWESWAETSGAYTECSDCFKLRKQQEREAANREAAEKSKTAGLPDLTGSEKQIAWATKIRQEFIDNHYPFDKPTTTEMIAGYGYNDFTPVSQDWWMEWLNNHNSSRFWIDKRENFSGICERIHEEWQEFREENLV